MKKLFFLTLFTGFFYIGNSQTYKGYVYDRSTQSPLPYAIIYISGTSAGTYTDDKGYFELNVSRYPGMPVTVSLIGYQSMTTKELFLNKLNKVYLTPKAKELTAVVVTAQENWYTYLKLFEREFLGETFNGKTCKILNEDDLRFKYTDDQGIRILDASAVRPVIIYNKSLGYTITYYLDKFRCTISYDRMGNENVETFNLGNYIFKDELSNYTKSEQLQLEERRKQAFLGSRMHFFRLLFVGDLKRSDKHNFTLGDSKYHSRGFIIRSETAVNSDSLLEPNDSISKYLINTGILFVKFQNSRTRLDVKMESVYFQKNGFFDPFDVSFNGGRMSQKRIGDLLPFDYDYNTEKL